MSNDDSRPPLNRPAAHLLDELESIKGLLADDGDDHSFADVPLLDDMVIAHLDDNTKLLNIEQIFGEDAIADEKVATIETAAIATPMLFPRFTLDVTISDDNNPIAEKPVAAPNLTSPKPRVRPDYSREVLIQELVDAFIPQIEAELHRRLRQLDDPALRRLQDPE